MAHSPRQEGPNPAPGSRHKNKFEGVAASAGWRGRRARAWAAEERRHRVARVRTPDKAGPAARVSSARPNVVCPACIARSASRSGPAAEWHAGKVAASGRSIRPTRLPSRPGEFHPESLTDPDVILSHHPARATKRRLPPSVDYRVPPVAG